MGFNATFRNLGRLRQIIVVLIKYGFEDLVSNSTVRNFVPENMRVRWIRQNKPVLQYTRWERMRMAVEELGPTFIKLAQILSNRPDLLPEELIKEFEKLQDKVPPFSSDEAIAIIERELNKKIDEIFLEFNPKPLASASIGQVHKGTLITGEDVVIKVQRPEVAELINRDLAILTEIVNRAERYLKKQGVLNAQEIVHVFKRSMSKELNYNNEARNISRFRETYKNYKNFYIPKVYRNISTDKVMVMEFVEGCRFTDIKQIRNWGLNVKKIVEEGFKIYLTQIFEFGYFHADPHPGNVLIRKDGVICLLDFGMVGQLMQKDKFAFANVFVGMAREDAKMMASNLRKLAIEDKIDDMRAFEYDVNELIEDYATLDVGEASIADMTKSLQKLMLDYQMKVPGSVFLIFRALAILEGIGKIMYPELKTYEYIKPFGKKIVQEQWSPENIISEVNTRISQVSGLLTSIPVELREILKLTRSGKIHIETELQGYGYLLKKLDSLTNRISITLIIMALIIGASITTTVTFPANMYTDYGLSYVSLSGYIAAGVLFVILVYAILRRRVYK